MTNQLNLSGAEIAQIRGQVGAAGSVGQYSAAYRMILSIDDAHRAQGLPGLDSNTRYWFEQAAAINANDQTSNSNLFIREVTTAGLLLDGRSTADLQAISNNIGATVIDQITDSGGVPPVGTLIASDISVAIRTGGQTIGGWGGAFYYWNEPYLTNADGTTQQTVGQYIQSHPDEYERFIATNARALSDTLAFDYSSGGPMAVLQDVILGGVNAQVSVDVAQEIFTTMLNGNRTGIYAGDPDAINGWQRTSNGVWQQVLSVDPNTGTPVIITADSAATANLEALRNLRIDPSYQDATRFPGLPNAMQGNIRGGFIDNNGSDVLQFADGQTDGTDNLVFNSNDGATANAASGQTLIIAVGNDQTVNATNGNGGDQAVIRGNNDTVNSDNTPGVRFDFSGTGGTINGSNADITLEDGASATVNGSGNALEEHRSAAVTVTGNNNTLDLEAGSSASVTGTDNSINLPGASVTQSTNADGGATISSGDTNITTPAGDAATFADQGNGVWSVSSWTAQGGTSDTLQIDPASENTDGTLFDLSITSAAGSVSTVAIPDASDFHALADGTFRDVETDASNSQTWLTRTSDYDALGEITQSTIDNHDGTSQVTVFDAAGQQSWASSETDYNAAHQVVETIVMNDDGTSASTAYDAANEQPWSTATETYGVDSNPIERTVVNDDGTRQVSEYDFTGQQQWFENETDYGAQGNVTRAAYDWNAGGSQVQLFNPAAEISEEVQNFSGADGAGTLTSESFDLPAATLVDTFNGDGTETLTSGGTSITAPAGASLALADEGGGAWSVASWSSGADTTDELTLNPANEGGDNSTLFNVTINPADGSGAVAVNIPDGSTFSALADGGFSVTETDPYNLSSWSSRTSDYDSRGQVTGRVQTNDDGTSEAMAYDPDNQQTWSLIQTQYDASGREIENLVYEDDGSSEQTRYDQAGQQTWSAVTDSYDATGSFTSETIFNDNGTQQLTLFNYDPQQPWFMAQGEYNTTGNLVEASYDWTAGGSETYAFDPSNGAVTAEAIYDASGQETELLNFAGSDGDNWETSQSTFDPSTEAETTRIYFSGSGPVDYATDQINFDPATGRAATEELYSNGLETDYIQYPATGNTYAIDAQYNSQGQVTDVRSYVGSAAHNYETEEVDYNPTRGAELSDNYFNASGYETQSIRYAGTTTDNWETNEIDYNAIGQETQEIDFAGSGPTDYETVQHTYNSTTTGETSREYFDTRGHETEYDTYVGTLTNDYRTSYESFNSSGVEQEYATFDAGGGPPATTNFRRTENISTSTPDRITRRREALPRGGQLGGLRLQPVRRLLRLS